MAALLGGNASHGEGAEAARIAHGKNAVGTDHHQREGAFDAAERVGNGFGERVFAGLRDQVHDDFRVAAGLENRTLRFHTSANFSGIGQIAVMRKRNHAFVRLHHDWLGVQQSGVAGGRVPRVPDGKSAANS